MYTRRFITAEKYIYNNIEYKHITMELFSYRRGLFVTQRPMITAC